MQNSTDISVTIITCNNTIPVHTAIMVSAIRAAISSCIILIYIGAKTAANIFITYVTTVVDVRSDEIVKYP